MPVHIDRSIYLFSAQQTQGTGSAMDARAVEDYGYLWFQCSAASARFTLQASHDNAIWMPVYSEMLTATQTGTAQLAGHFPYLRCSAGPIYSGTGGASNFTGTLWVHYAPGIKHG